MEADIFHAVLQMDGEACHHSFQDAVRDFTNFLFNISLQFYQSLWLVKINLLLQVATKIKIRERKICQGMLPEL